MMLDWSELSHFFYIDIGYTVRQHLLSPMSSLCNTFFPDIMECVNLNSPLFFLKLRRKCIYVKNKGPVS